MKKMKSSMREPVGGLLISKGYPNWTFYWNGSLLNIENMDVGWKISDGFFYCGYFDDIFSALDDWDSASDSVQYEC